MCSARCSVTARLGEVGGTCAADGEGLGGGTVRRPADGDGACDGQVGRVVGQGAGQGGGEGVAGVGVGGAAHPGEGDGHADEDEHHDEGGQHGGRRDVAAPGRAPADEGRRWHGPRARARPDGGAAVGRSGRGTAAGGRGSRPTGAADGAGRANGARWRQQDCRPGRGRERLRVVPRGRLGCRSRCVTHRRWPPVAVVKRWQIFHGAPPPATIPPPPCGVQPQAYVGLKMVATGTRR